ncbi:MAG: alginate O-acetyltransferase AlgX-related protein [Christensenellaceae bacterium]|jgi:alginate O-acetyltransferase complex protein AlgJ
MKAKKKQILLVSILSAAAFFAAFLTALASQATMPMLAAVPIAVAAACAAILVLVFKKSRTMTCKKITIGCFAALLLFPMLTLPLMSGREVENIENRFLNTEFPPFRLEDYETYPRSLDAFINDTVPFRQEMIQTHSAILMATGSSPNDTVIIGDNNWLFYGNAQVMDEYMGMNLLNENQLAQIAQNLQGLQNYLAEQGIPLYVAVCPEKQTIYPEYMPERYYRAAYTSTQQITDYLSGTGLNFLYFKDSLTEAKDRCGYLYYTTDTHWCDTGAYIAFDELMQQMKTDYVPLDFSDEDVLSYSGTGGDLNQLTFSSAWIPKTGTAFTDDFFVQRGKLSERSGTLLLMHDSFEYAMDAFLRQEYDQVLYNENYAIFTEDLILSSGQPDAVLLLMVERNAPGILLGELADWAKYAG